MDQFERQLQNIPKLRARPFFKFLLTRKLHRAARQLDEPRRGFRVFRSALATALVLFLLVSGTTAYAYASPSITHGNPLYALKRSVEQTQLFFVRDAERRVTLLSWIAERRLQEVEILLKKRLGDAEPISFIPKAYAQSLLETLDPNDPLALTIRDMLQATEKAAELTESITEPRKAGKALEALERVTKMQKRVLVAPQAVLKAAVRSSLHEAFQKAAELHEETQRAKASVSIAIEDEEPEVIFTLFPKRKWKGAEHALERAEETLHLIEKNAPTIDTKISEHVVSQVKKSIAETRDSLSNGDTEKSAQLTKKTMELTRSARELLLPKTPSPASLPPPTAPEPSQKPVQKRALQSLEKAEQELSKLPEDALRSSLEEKVETAKKALEGGDIFDAIQAAKEVRVTAKEKLFQDKQEPEPAEHIPPQEAVEHIPPQNLNSAEHIPPQKSAEHIPPQEKNAEPSLVELERRFASLRLLFEKMDERKKALEEGSKVVLPKDISHTFFSIKSKIANFTALFGRTRTDEQKFALLKELDAIEGMIDALKKDLSSR